MATYHDRVIVEDPRHSIPIYIGPQVEDVLGYPLSACLDEGGCGSRSCTRRTGIG